MSKHSAFHPDGKHEEDMTAGVPGETGMHAASISHAAQPHTRGFFGGKGGGKKAKKMKQEGGKGMSKDESCE